MFLSQSILLWLNHLPIRFNLDEAKISHKFLSSMMEMSEEKVIGPGGSCIPITIFLLSEDFGSTYAADKDKQTGVVVDVRLDFRKEIEWSGRRIVQNAKVLCMPNSVMWTCNPNGDINVVDVGLSQMVGLGGLVSGRVDCVKLGS
ncbi:hypothetical protein CQW23_22114 [Capsicum baccatum]|uniref:Uncharacterized protein n=1 Tax=Capsicum baccatum TaxID=33114 RepID=A0A2G2W003_CAPBA|nr:hypothetical protein CQW23_22114 [Capsicum baccatum]